MHPIPDPLDGCPNIDRTPLTHFAEEEYKTPVLMIGVHNAVYPITPEVIQAITAPHAPVRRINISRKSGIQVAVVSCFKFSHRLAGVC